MIRSVNGQRAVIKGIKEFNLSWEAHEGNIYKADINEDVWQLFKNREQLVPARWPNASFDDNSVFDYTNWARPNNNNGPDGSIIDNDLSSSPFAGKSLDNASAVLNFGSWTSWHLPVLTFAGNTITVQPNTLRYRSKQHYYFLEGSVDFIDIDGEWSYNKTEQAIYAYANNISELQNAVFEGKTQSYALEFNNCSNIRIEGIEFFGTTFKATDVTDFTVYDSKFNYPSASKRMIGGYDPIESTFINNTNLIGSANNVRIERCLFQNTDGRALWLYGNNIKVYDCIFRYIDWSVANNTLCAAVDGRSSIYNEYKNNTIHTTGAMTSISPGEIHTTTFNDVSNFGLLQSDGAAIHCTRTEVADSEIAYNWIYEGLNGHFDHRSLRFDAPVSEPELAGTNGLVHHNVTWNTASLFLKGNDHFLFNNTVLESNSGNGIAILRESGSNEGTVVKNNLVSTMGPHRSQSDAQSSYNMPVETSNNWNGYDYSGVQAESLIVSKENRDFSPTSSAVIDQGVVFTEYISDFSTIGTPDIGAYEAGGTYWVPGITWEEEVSIEQDSLSLGKPSIFEDLEPNHYVSHIEYNGTGNLTYSLPANTLDNQFFKIGTTLSDRLYANNTVFDYQTQSSYEIRIEARDSNGALVATNDFIIEVLSLLSLSKPNILEGLAANHYVSHIVSDGSENLTYSLPANTLDNQFFKIGTTLSDRLYANNTVFNYLTQNAYDIRIEARNSSGTLVAAKDFTIDILSLLSLSKPSISEGLAPNHYVSHIEYAGTDSYTYSLPVNVLDNQFFKIGMTLSDRLYANNTVFNYQAQNSYEIKIEARDSSGTLVATDEFVIDVLSNSAAKVGLSKTKSTTSDSTNSVIIYPNPAESYINISGSDIDKIVDVNIFSLNGKLIKKSFLDVKMSNDDTYQINIDILASGTFYILEIHKNDGSIEHYKLLKK